MSEIQIFGAGYIAGLITAGVISALIIYALVNLIDKDGRPGR